MAGKGDKPRVLPTSKKWRQNYDCIDWTDTQKGKKDNGGKKKFCLKMKPPTR